MAAGCSRAAGAGQQGAREEAPRLNDAIGMSWAWRNTCSMSIIEVVDTIEQGDRMPLRNASLVLGASVLGLSIAQSTAALAQGGPGGGVAAHYLDVREAAFGDARIRERES